MKERLGKGKSVFSDFRQFLLRGNVIDLAVAVVIGAAFNGVIQSIVRDLITPLISLIAGQPDFSRFSFVIHGATFLYGDLINTLIYFVILAAVVFFLVVRPVNVLVSLARRQQPDDPTTKKCPECLSEIPIDARRCAHCAQLVSK